MTQVTIKFVNQPQAGKKNGSVRLSDDSYLGVPPAMLSQFQPGGTYDVQYDSRQWQGKEYRTVTSVKEVASATNGHAGPAKAGAVFRSPMQLFVSEALCAAIGAPNCQLQLTKEAMQIFVREAKAVWYEDLAEAQKGRDDMDDQIPW